MRRHGWIGAAATLLALAAAAQVVGASAQLVTTAPVAPVKVTPGRTAKVQFAFRVQPGLHINSNKPNSELLLPTKLNLQTPANLTIAGLSYPPGQSFKLAFSDDKLSVYTGDFEVDGTVTAAGTMKPGTYAVAGELQYQACNDRQCFPPKKLPVEFNVVVK